jgi:protein SCO1/2
MKILLAALVVGLLMGLALSGCSQPTPNTDTSVKEYDIKGKVVSIDRDVNTIKLDHEDIPGLMKAMTMNFPVENAKTLEKLEAGDQVEGKLKIMPGKYVLTQLEKR